MLGAIAFTSTPSPKNRSEDVFLFHRTLFFLSKGPTSAQPSCNKKYFDNTTELYEAVDNFMLNESEAMALLEDTYGLPMGTWCISKIEDLSQMFSEARNGALTSFNEDISAWDTSKATTMKEMFSHMVSSSFNQDLSSWDTSKVTTMSNMFGGATSFNQDLSSWKTSSVEDFSYMFRTATSFNRAISAWDTSKASSMYAMFLSAESFDSELTSWDVENVRDLAFMFYQAKSFNSDLSAWDVSKASSMSSMFNGAESFNHSLCDWGVKLATNANATVTEMFSGTICPQTTAPNLTATPPGPLCYLCV
jgi:surface protein